MGNRFSGWICVLALALVAGSARANAGSFQISSPAGLSPSDTTLNFLAHRPPNLALLLPSSPAGTP